MVRMLSLALFSLFCATSVSVPSLRHEKNDVWCNAKVDIRLSCVSWMDCSPKLEISEFNGFSKSEDCESDGEYFGCKNHERLKCTNFLSKTPQV